MRRVLVSLVLGASLAVIGAGSAFGFSQPLPDAACNQGTASTPDPHNGVWYVPMDMEPGVAGGCMTMNQHNDARP